jgi:hypothetical protein
MNDEFDNSSNYTNEELIIASSLKSKTNETASTLMTYVNGEYSHLNFNEHFHTQQEENSNRNQIDFETFSQYIYNELIDDVIFGVILQIHRASNLGYLMYMDPDLDSQFLEHFKMYSDYDVLGIFSNFNETNTSNTSNSKTSNNGNGGRNGQSSNSNSLLKYECHCPNCGRSLAAIRFAPHLEKCMGMGRSSSRIATRRIANYNDDEFDQLIEATGLIPNSRYVESSNTNNTTSALNINSQSSTSSSTSSSSVNNNSNTNNNNTDDHLMSIINAVATASNNQDSQVYNNSSSQSLVDIDLSSNSSSSSNNANYLKPPVAKKKRIHYSKSNSSLSSSSVTNSSSLSTTTAINTQLN